MNKFNLKYLVTAVVIISLLIVGGAYLFTTLSPQSKPQTQSPSPNADTIQPAIAKPNTIQEGGSGQTPSQPKLAPAPPLIK